MKGGESSAVAVSASRHRTLKLLHTPDASLHILGDSMMFKKLVSLLPKNKKKVALLLRVLEPKRIVLTSNWVVGVIYAGRSMELYWLRT